MFEVGKPIRGSLFICLAFLCIVPNLAAKDLRFQRYTIVNGLPHDGIYGLLQDHHGFIWIGTERGICRFDGHQFLVYEHDPLDANSLKVNNIRSLIEGEDGQIWIGTWGGGLNLFKPDSHQFSHYLPDPKKPSQSLASNRVQTLAFDQNNQLWVGTYQAGLSRINPGTGGIENFPHHEDGRDGLPSGRVWTIESLDKTRVLFGTDAGLSVFDQNKGFEHFSHDPDNPFSLACNQVRDALVLQNGQILIGTECGLQLFYPNNRIFREFHLGPESGQTIVSQSLFQDHEGHIWVGTLGEGLFRIDSQTEEITQYVHNPSDSESLVHNSIQVVFQDRSHVLWVGTLGGLSKADLKPQKFKQHRHVHQDPTTISSDAIGSIFEDHAGDLWVGTYGEGLNHIDKKTNIVTHYGPKSSKYIPNRVVNAIYESEPGTLWLSTLDSGLVRFKPKQGTYKVFQNIPNDDQSISSNRVRETIGGQNNSLWLATDRGVNQFNQQTESFITPDNHQGLALGLGKALTYTVRLDHKRRLWAGTERGPRIMEEATFAAWTLNLNDPHWERVHQLPIYSLHASQRGDLWLGTNAGLYCINPEEQTIAAFSQNEGLISNNVLDILEDQAGILWLTTDQGLSRLDPLSGSIQNFDFRDGLTTNAFNHNASFASKSGTLYLGSRRGYNSVVPAEVLPNPFVPPVFLTGITLMQKPFAIGNKALQVKDLDIDYATKMVSFEFASLDFTLPEKNRFQYKLEGFNDDWIDAGTQPIASYTNLSPGRYTFRARGSNNDGLWNDEGIQLNLRVIPPWWRTPLAFIGMILGAIFLIIGFPLWRIRYLERQSKKLHETIDRQTKTVRQRNLQLEEKNNELITLDEIVVSINQEWRMDSLVKTLLTQAQKLFPNAQHGSFLKFDHKEHLFKFVAATDQRHPGLLEIRLTRDLALQRYTAGRKKVNEGVYILSQYTELPEGHTLSNYQKPATLMVMTLEHKNRIDAILLLENYEDRNAFRDSDVEKLKRFRDHATSALAKANLMNELALKAKHLYDTRQLLMENAHQAGMAEVASNVLHSVGNALNSINTSADIINEIGRDSPITLFEKISGLISDNQDQLEFFLKKDPIGQKLPDALQKISHSLLKSQQNTLTELDILKNHIHGLRQVVQAQQDYANMDGAVFETQIEACIEEAIQIEQSILESKEIRIVREFSNLPPLKVQKSKLLRILVHLIGHAAEAMSQQASRILFLRTSMGNHRFSIEVRDTGVGLSKEKIATLFHQSFSGESGQKGLGLHYCATAAHEMGGQLTASSLGPSQGSRFTLTLPMAVMGNSAPQEDFSQDVS